MQFFSSILWSPGYCLLLTSLFNDFLAPFSSPKFTKIQGEFIFGLENKVLRNLGDMNLIDVPLDRGDVLSPDQVSNRRGTLVHTALLPVTPGKPFHYGRIVSERVIATA
jgi:hypothetical protein